MSTGTVVGQLRVVIIDDTADLRELLRSALVRGGMALVGEAGDGLAGIEAVRATNPDVVLLDLSMPVMDGLEALPTIRALVPAARIIVLSGFGASQMSERALEIGADAYLQKGASLGRILDHIRDAVGTRSGPVAGPVTEHEAEQAAETVSGPVPAPRAPSPRRDPISLAPYGVLEVGADPPYRVLAANPAAIELLGQQPVPGTALAESAHELAAAIAGVRLRGDVSFEASLGRAVRVTLRHTDDSLLVYLQEISDEVAHLRTAIATTAHELRGPVAVLCAVAETLTEDDVSDTDRNRLLESVGRQAKMLDGITADLLVEAQAERGTLRIEVRTVELTALLADVVSDRYARTVRIEVTDHRPVLADPIRLEQMVGNLLTNAHKYGDPPVVIRVRTSREHPDCLCIDVEDDGSGVPLEFRARLFCEFTRAAGTAVPGTGLGLHVVHTLAQAQGGSISYRSREPRGSVFTLTLPVSRR
ncbi:MAG: ATP-binding region, ATPase domain protein [Marmoricola sp.]|nr:ATP-binding region, ATPase domain protein [Marmoricola sp.]